MAVDTSGITTVYNALIVDAKATLDAEYDASRIDSAVYAQGLLASIGTAMQLAVSSVQQQDTVDAQAAEILASTIRQDTLSEEQIDLLQSQDLEVLASTTRQDNESAQKVILITEQHESEAKQNITDGILDKQLADIIAGTALKGSQDAEILASTVRSDDESSANITLMTEQTESEAKKNVTDGLIDKQVLDIVSGTSLKDEQAAKVTAETTLTDSKDAEVLADTIRKDAMNTKQLSLIDNQILKLIEDTLFVATQETELTNSVGYNNKIKALDSYSDMIGTIGAGGLTIDAPMWVTYFEMVNGLNSDGSTPSSTDITLVATTS